jgi:hypothetical protein
MAIEDINKFLYDIGYPLGVSTMKLKDFMKVITLLDIYTYDKNYVFFYDVLTELTKYYLIQSSITDEMGEGNLFNNQEEITEEKAQLFEGMNNE